MVVVHILSKVVLKLLTGKVESSLFASPVSHAAQQDEFRQVRQSLRTPGKLEQTGIGPLRRDPNPHPSLCMVVIGAAQLQGCCNAYISNND